MPASAPNNRIEEIVEKKINSKKQIIAPVAFGSKVFSLAQLKMAIYRKEFLAIYFACLELSHIVWETTLPTLDMTVNRSSTRFFRTKAIPRTLWNACDYVIQFNFHIMHVAGTQKAAATFFFTNRTTHAFICTLASFENLLFFAIKGGGKPWFVIRFSTNFAKTQLYYSIF